MKKIYRLKKTAKNEFTRLTGVYAIRMEGGNGCILTDNKTIRGNDVKRYAYCLYNGYDHGKKNTSIKMSNSCGVLNCVKSDHLVANYKPKKELGKELKENVYGYEIEWLSNRHDVPVPLLSEFLK